MERTDQKESYTCCGLQEYVCSPNPPLVIGCADVGRGRDSDYMTLKEATPKEAASDGAQSLKLDTIMC